MKKTLLYFMLLVSAYCLSAQNPDKNILFKLASIESDDYLETVYYTYKNNNLLCTSSYTMNDGTQVIDSLFYDNAGNPTRITFHQLINNQWRWTSYVDFTYDNNGNRTSRKNYNDFGSGFQLGGEYQYTYNTDNQLIYWELYMGGELSQICDLSYNEDGLVIEEIGQASLWGSPMENSWKLTYEYDANNNLSSRAQSFWYGSSWDLYNVDQYFYDDHNNCIKWDNLIGNTVVDRHEYVYDFLCTYDQLVFPNNPEAFFPEFVQMNNRLVIDKWYTEDASGVLSYICDYNYTYDFVEPQGFPILTVSPDSINFHVEILKDDDQGTISISNSGTADGEINAVITGEDASLFAFANDSHAIIEPDSFYDLIINCEIPTPYPSTGLYEATVLIATNDPESPAFEILIVLDLQNDGIDDIPNSIDVFPNPASETLNIQAMGLHNVSLYDMTGRLVFTNNSTSNNQQVNVSDYSHGVYMLKIKLSSGKTTTKQVIIGD